MQEKDIQPYFNFKADCYTNGFPKAPLINKELITESTITNTGKKKSLFAQHYSTFNEQKDFGKTVDSKSCDEQFIKKDIVIDKDIDMFVHNQVASGSNLICEKAIHLNESSNESYDINKAEIHQENVQRLQDMTEEDIMDEQRNLLETLGMYVISNC